jgi:hypothetical protein
MVPHYYSFSVGAATGGDDGTSSAGVVPLPNLGAVSRSYQLTTRWRARLRLDNGFPLSVGFGFFAGGAP